MSADDVHPNEMERMTGDDDAPQAVTAFLADVRAAAAATPLPAIGPELAMLFEHGTDPVPAPAPSRRRRRVAAIAGGALAGVTFGGLSVAGALPASVQDRVAGVAEVVGLHLPDGQDAPDTTPSPASVDDAGHTSSTPPVSTPPVSVPVGPGAAPGAPEDGADGPGASNATPPVSTPAHDPDPHDDGHGADDDGPPPAAEQGDVHANDRAPLGDGTE